MRVNPESGAEGPKHRIEGEKPGRKGNRVAAETRVASNALRASQAKVSISRAPEGRERAHYSVQDPTRNAVASRCKTIVARATGHPRGHTPTSLSGRTVRAS